MMENALLSAAALIAGAVAAVTGFGIGSILTPLLALSVGIKTAVAAIAIPHFLGTFLRFWILRRHIDRRVLLGFGLTSAAGGLAGALLHDRLAGTLLTLIFGFLLVFAGIMGVSGLSRKMKFGRKTSWVAGGLSGIFGGLVGNQGGIRSAALLGFDVSKEAFVATATAIGVIVDLARMPVYFFTESQNLRHVLPQITWAALGVVGGTVLGMIFLRRIPQNVFRTVVSAFIFVLGIYMVMKGFKS